MQSLAGLIKGPVNLIHHRAEKNPKTKIMETFGKLFGRPRVLDLAIDEKGLTTWIEHHSSEPLQAARAWVEQYNMRHRKDSGG
jgi:hypothetical protein